MNIVHSRSVQPAERAAKVVSLLETIREGQLREWVERIAVPRHFIAEERQNRATGDWLCEVFQSMGYRVERQGEHRNIVALPAQRFEELVLVGAHYDTVPGCPGADDNGSAVAAMLGCATACSLWRPMLPVGFVAFNREEEHLRGSPDFVGSWLPTAPFKVRCAHVLEMVGYASSAPGSQRVPTGLPINIEAARSGVRALPFNISDRGDFLGLLANGDSTEFMDLVLRSAATYVPELPVTGLTVRLGLERFLPVLGRSDHVPFWEQKVPAVMWTDTSEFRNAHYHRETDRPETLDYGLLGKVCKLLTACLIAQQSNAE